MSTPCNRQILDVSKWSLLAQYALARNNTLYQLTVGLRYQVKNYFLALFIIYWIGGTTMKSTIAVTVIENMTYADDKYCIPSVDPQRKIWNSPFKYEQENSI